MPRTARIVVPGLPHHVTQRGNRGQDVFATPDDRARYLELLKLYGDRYELAIQGYCLMTNHVHLVVVPAGAESLAKALRSTHMRYTQTVNAAAGSQGHLWQGRYYSCPLDDAHHLAALRYVDQNPVRAGLVETAVDYPWSSAAAHCGLRPEPLLSGGLPGELTAADWARELATPVSEAELIRLRRRTGRGQPCGDDAFVARVAALIGRELSTRGPGRPRKRPLPESGDRARR